MRLRQVALVARDLEPVVAELCAVLGAEVCFRDPGVASFGLRNAVMPLGDSFLEVVSPAQAGTSAGRFLERRGGDGGYMVIVQTPDLDADRKRLSELGVRVVWEIRLEDIATLHLHPRDVGGAILSLDQAQPPESWRWAGPDWPARRGTGVSRAIAAVELASAAPEALARRWSQILALPARAMGELWSIDLDEGALRFAPTRDGDARGAGVAGIDVAAADPTALLAAARRRGLPLEGDAFRAGGVWIRPVP
jgi:hypothetical protein